MRRFRNFQPAAIALVYAHVALLPFVDLHIKMSKALRCAASLTYLDKHLTCDTTPGSADVMHYILGVSYDSKPTSLLINFSSYSSSVVVGGCLHVRCCSFVFAHLSVLFDDNIKALVGSAVKVRSLVEHRVYTRKRVLYQLKRKVIEKLERGDE